LFSASALYSESEPWAPDDPTIHLRVHTHPSLGLPAAPFHVHPGIGEPITMIDQESAFFTDPSGASVGFNTPRVPGPEFYIWLAHPSAGILLQFDLPSGGTVVIDVLSPLAGGALADLQPVARHQSRGEPIAIGGSGISLLRVLCPSDATVRSARTWERLALKQDKLLITSFGPPSEGGRWYTPTSVPTLLDGVGTPPFDPAKPLEQSYWRIVNGAPQATGPADREPGKAIGVDLASRQDVEWRRVRALRDADPSNPLDASLHALLNTLPHPLVDPPTLSATMSRDLPTSGQTATDKLSMRLQDLLVLASVDAGIARWLGVMMPLPDTGALSSQILHESEMDWLPMVVVGFWRVPIKPLDRWPALTSLAASQWNLKLTAPNLLASYSGVSIDDDPDTNTQVLALACCVAAPARPEPTSIPSAPMLASAGNDDRAWVEPSGQGPVRWRQRLRFPRRTWQQLDGGTVAGSRLAIRRDPDRDDVLVTPCLQRGVDEDLVGRGVAWLPRSNTTGGPRFIDGAVPDGDGTNWAAWVIDEFGRWSEEASQVSASPPAPLDPHPPGLQIQFLPASFDEADGREGRGHLWVRASIGEHQPAGTKAADAIEVTVGGVTTSLPSPGFDTGWVDRGLDLPVLGPTADGKVTVTARTVFTPPGADPNASRSTQVVAIVDGRPPPTIADPPQIRWTSRPTPVGTATLRYTNPSSSVTPCVVHLVDEPRLHYRFAEQLHLDAPESSRPRTERAAWYWSHRSQLDPSDFTVVGATDPGHPLDLTVPGRLDDLMMVKVVAQRPSGRPSSWNDAPTFLYAVPDLTIPPPPIVTLSALGGLLKAKVEGAAGGLPPNRWQLLSCSDPSIEDTSRFLRTTRTGDVPPEFQLNCPPWVPVRIAARAAIAPEALSTVASENPPNEWSAATSPRTFMYVPVDAPAAPTVAGALAPSGIASLSVMFPVPLDPRVVGRHAVVITRHPKPVGAAVALPPTALPAVTMVDAVTGLAVSTVTVDDAAGADAESYIVAVRDPSGRVGTATVVLAADLVPIP
jgi:hypothetical protein